MADLSINISNTPAKAATAKPSGNDDAAQQDAQDFGGVLSRQVADTARPPASSHTSSGKNDRQAAGQESTESADASDAASAVPADILAALLAQQSQATLPPADAAAQPQLTGMTDATAQPDANLQAALNLQTLAGAAPALAGGTGGSAAALADAGATQPLLNSALQERKGLNDTFKTAGLKESGLSVGNTPAGASFISDPASATQQAVIVPLLGGATAPSGPLSISTPVNQPAWGDEFGQKITWMANQRNQTAELHLNPPQLGPLDVVLKMNGDQASAVFTSPHAAVREAIEQAIPKLRELLADNGIMLGNAMVNDHAAKHDRDTSPRKAQDRAPLADGATEVSGIQEVRVSGSSRHHGMVDTFA